MWINNRWSCYGFSACRKEKEKAINIVGELLRKGICWRVGNGRSILAHQDPWIPDITAANCRGIHADFSNVKVAQYIQTEGAWNEHAVRQEFPTVVAEAILNITLSRRDCEDIRYWKDSKDGKYSVKAGYYLENQGAAPPPYQSSHPFKDWWRIIWRLNIPPKVRIFIWRASRNYIPVSMNLLAHHVPVDGFCLACKSQLASTSHVLIFCPSIKNVWKYTVFWYDLKSIRGASFIELASMISKRFKEEDIELFVIMCWAIWTEICKRNHDPRHYEKEIQLDWIYSFLEAFRQSNRASNSSIFSTGHVARCWEPPDPNLLRLDVDAGFDVDRDRYSVGAVVRDEFGLVRGAAANVIRNPGTVLRAELLAIRFGMEFCLNLGMTDVCVCSDSSQAVHAIKSASEDLGPNGLLIKDIQALMLSSAFNSINHMFRESNMAAHRVAHEAFAVSHYVEWLNGCIPLWLSSIVSLDCLSL